MGGEGGGRRVEPACPRVGNCWATTHRMEELGREQKQSRILLLLSDAASLYIYVCIPNTFFPFFFLSTKFPRITSKLYF